MEGKTHYEKIIGGTKEDQDKARRELQEVFERSDQELARHQIEKTEEDKEIIAAVKNISDAMAKQWGGDPKPLPLEKIYLLPPGTIEKIRKGKKGVHTTISLNIGAERSKSNIEFAGTLAHEFFHQQGFRSARIGPNKETYGYRSGISMEDLTDLTLPADERRVYFHYLEEAIVEECERRLLKILKKDPLVEKESVATERLKKLIVEGRMRLGVPEGLARVAAEEIESIDDAEAIYARIASSSKDEGEKADYMAGYVERLTENNKISFFSRYEEREKMWSAIHDIFERSSGEFKNEEEIFDEFARAHFSGNYMKLARIIERTMGKGYFRKLAEGSKMQTKDGDE